MHNKLKDEDMDFLMEIISKLSTEKECYDFFEDLCTIQELKSMSQRLVVAHMLTQGAVYGDIAAKTGASSATISRVNRCLNYGSGGYKSALSKAERRE